RRPLLSVSPAASSRARVPPGPTPTLYWVGPRPPPSAGDDIAERRACLRRSRVEFVTLGRRDLLGALRRSERRRATARKLRPVRSAAAFDRDLSRCLARPKGSEIDRRVPRSPALHEALDRRVQNDIVELLQAEQAVPANCCISRVDSLERAPAEVGGKDDVHDVLGGVALHG